MNKKLVEFRISKNYSIQKMADEIGVSKSFYEKIEYGERKPSYNFITKFSRRFPDVKLDFLFFS